MDSIETVSYTVPIDVLIDIAEIIVKHELPHQIKDIKENALLVKLSFSERHNNAKKNIEHILSEYEGLLKEMEGNSIRE